MSELHAYGREDLAAEVAASRAPLTLVTGDSYVGKTTVLKLASKLVSNAKVTDSIELDWGEGSFRSGFLQALAKVVAVANADRTAIERFGRRILEAAEGMTHALGQHVARQIGIELLTFIGGAGGRTALKVAETAAATFPRDLQTRLAEANAGIVADSLAAFAAEVEAFADAPLILVLDSGEHLSETDLRVFIDSVRRFPSGVRLWMGFATRSDVERRTCADLIDQLEGKPNEIEVPPLTEPAIESWLRDAGLHDASVETAMQWSGGYPMLLGDLVADLERGAPVHELPLNKQFVERSRANLKRLDRQASLAARRLSILPNQPSEETLRDLLELDASSWARLVDELVDARIFTQLVDSRPWFHEQRRRFIVSELREAEARESREAALAVLRRQFERDLQAFLIAQAQSDVRLLEQVQLELREDASDEVSLLRGRLFRALGDYPQALTLLAESPRDPRDWSAVEVEAAHNRAEILRLSGQYAQALSVWDRLRQYGRIHEDLLAEARSAWGRSLTYKMIDAAREALELCDQADRLRHAAKQSKGSVPPDLDPYPEVRRGHFSRHRAELHCYLGDYARAAEDCSKGFHFYRAEEGSPSWWELAATEALLLRLEGRFQSSLERAKEAQEGFQQGQFGWKRGTVTILRHLAQGEMVHDVEAAGKTWNQLLQVDPRIYPQAPLYAHLGLGECARMRGVVGEALEHYAGAERLAKSLYGREGKTLTSRFGFGREHAYALLGRAASLDDDSSTTEHAREAFSYATKRQVPWLEFWASWLLIRASNSQPERDQYVEAAEKAARGFTRRPGDADLEGAALRALKNGDPEAAPMPFNFP